MKIYLGFKDEIVSRKKIPQDKFGIITLGKQCTNTSYIYGIKLWEKVQ
jgi:hypothetical protein